MFNRQICCLFLKKNACKSTWAGQDSRKSSLMSSVRRCWSGTSWSFSTIRKVVSNHFSIRTTSRRWSFSTICTIRSRMVWSQSESASRISSSRWAQSWFAKQRLLQTEKICPSKWSSQTLNWWRMWSKCCYTIAAWLMNASAKITASRDSWCSHFKISWILMSESFQWLRS